MDKRNHPFVHKSDPKIATTLLSKFDCTKELQAPSQVFLDTIKKNFVLLTKAYFSPEVSANPAFIRNMYMIITSKNIKIHQIIFDESSFPKILSDFSTEFSKIDRTIITRYTLILKQLFFDFDDDFISKISRPIIFYHSFLHNISNNIIYDFLILFVSTLNHQMLSFFRRVSLSSVLFSYLWSTHNHLLRKRYIYLLTLFIDSYSIDFFSDISTDKLLLPFIEVANIKKLFKVAHTTSDFQLSEYHFQLLLSIFRICCSQPPDFLEREEEEAFTIISNNQELFEAKLEYFDSFYESLCHYLTKDGPFLPQHRIATTLLNYVIQHLFYSTVPQPQNTLNQINEMSPALKDSAVLFHFYPNGNPNSSDPSSDQKSSSDDSFQDHVSTNEANSSPTQLDNQAQSSNNEKSLIQANPEQLQNNKVSFSFQIDKTPINEIPSHETMTDSSSFLNNQFLSSQDKSTNKNVTIELFNNSSKKFSSSSDNNERLNNNSFEKLNLFDNYPNCTNSENISLYTEEEAFLEEECYFEEEYPHPLSYKVMCKSQENILNYSSKEPEKTEILHTISDGSSNDLIKLNDSRKFQLRKSYKQTRLQYKTKAKSLSIPTIETDNHCSSNSLFSPTHKPFSPSFSHSKAKSVSLTFSDTCQVITPNHFSQSLPNTILVNSIESNQYSQNSFSSSKESENSSFDEVPHSQKPTKMIESSKSQDITPLYEKLKESYDKLPSKLPSKESSHLTLQNSNSCENLPSLLELASQMTKHKTNFPQSDIESIIKVASTPRMRLNKIEMDLDQERFIGTTSSIADLYTEYEININNSSKHPLSAPITPANRASPLSSSSCFSIREEPETLDFTNDEKLCEIPESYIMRPENFKVLPIKKTVRSLVKKFFTYSNNSFLHNSLLSLLYDLSESTDLLVDIIDESGLLEEIIKVRKNTNLVHCGYYGHIHEIIRLMKTYLNIKSVKGKMDEEEIEKEWSEIQNTFNDRENIMKENYGGFTENLRYEDERQINLRSD